MSTRPSFNPTPHFWTGSLPYMQGKEVEKDLHPLIKDWREISVCLEASAKQHESVLQMLDFAQKSALFPPALLYVCPRPEQNWSSAPRRGGAANKPTRPAPAGRSHPWVTIVPLFRCRCR